MGERARKREKAGRMQFYIIEGRRNERASEAQFQRRKGEGGEVGREIWDSALFISVVNLPESVPAREGEGWLAG